MMRRQARVVIAVLCALAVCAVAASSASATGTTAFTCVEGKGAKDFKDAHCTNQVEAGAGSFGHVAIEPGIPQEIELTNAQTSGETTAAQPFLLVGSLAGIPVEIKCTTVGGGGNLTNTEEGGGMHAGGEVSIQLSGCTVPKPANCSVNNPITYVGTFKTYQKGSEMGVEFAPMGGGGGTFTQITFTGTKCALAGTFAVKGNFEGTPGGTSEGKGATLGFTESMGSLTWAGYPYKVIGTITWKLKGGSPIILTTT